MTSNTIALYKCQKGSVFHTGPSQEDIQVEEGNGL